MPDAVQDLRGRLVTAYRTSGEANGEKFRLELFGTVGSLEMEGLKIKRLQFTGPVRKRYFNDSQFHRQETENDIAMGEPTSIYDMTGNHLIYRKGGSWPSSSSTR